MVRSRKLPEDVQAAVLIDREIGGVQHLSGRQRLTRDCGSALDNHNQPIATTRPRSRPKAPALSKYLWSEKAPFVTVTGELRWHRRPTLQCPKRAARGLFCTLVSTAPWIAARGATRRLARRRDQRATVGLLLTRVPAVDVGALMRVPLATTRGRRDCDVRAAAGTSALRGGPGG
jgi:hypothetical protein